MLIKAILLMLISLQGSCWHSLDNVEKNETILEEDGFLPVHAVIFRVILGESHKKSDFENIFTPLKVIGLKIHPVTFIPNRLPIKNSRPIKIFIRI